MEIKRVIVHELVKEQMSEVVSPELSKKVSLKLSEKVSEIDDNFEKLVMELDNRFNALDIRFASFKTSADTGTKEPGNKDDGKSKEEKPHDANQFKVALDGYFITKGDKEIDDKKISDEEKKIIDESFKIFTGNVMEKLKDIIGTEPLAKGGYFVFADYVKEIKEEKNTRRANYVGIFLIRHTEGLKFIKKSDEDTFSVDIVTAIDFEKMAMACRIDREKFDNKTDRCLSFVTRRNEKISDYFINWLSAGDMKDNSMDTGQFLDILEVIPLPNGKSRDQFKQDVYNEIQEDPEKKIRLKRLAEKFLGDDTIFVKFAEDNRIDISHEFKADLTILRRIIVIRARTKTNIIDLRFQPSLFGSSVRLDKNNLDMITIRNRELADEIRKKMGIAIAVNKKSTKAAA